MTFQSLSIVMTASDEVASLKESIEYLLRFDQDIGEIIVVLPTWASSDCMKMATALAEKYVEKVKMLIQKRKGLGGAIRDGIDLASGSHILYAVSDLAISLDVVPKLLEIEKEYPEDIAKSSRFMEGGGFVDYSKSRLLLNKIAQVFLRVLYQSSVKDLTNPVQIADAALYHSVSWHETEFPMLEEMVLVPARLRIRFHEVPCFCYGRKEGESKNSFFQTAAYFKTAIRTRFVPRKKLFKNDWK